MYGRRRSMTTGGGGSLYTFAMESSATETKPDDLQYRYDSIPGEEARTPWYRSAYQISCVVLLLISYFLSQYDK